MLNLIAKLSNDFYRVELDLEKKLLFYVDQLGNGGAERVASVLLNSFSDNEFKKYILSFEKADIEYSIPEDIKKEYILTKKNRESTIRVINWVKRVEKIRDTIKKYSPDIILSLAKPTTNLYLLLACCGLNIKIILSERSSPNYYPKSLFMRKVRNFSYLLASGVVFQSESARDYFSKSIQKKGIVIPNPILPDLPTIHNEKSNKRIITACRLSEEKNLPMLIKSFWLFEQKYPDYYLEIYGDGPCRKELEDLALRLNIHNKVKFMGFTKNVHLKMAEGGIFVLTSNFEGLSNSMLEAMAIGMPVICTDAPIGTARQYIKSYMNGILIPVGDVDALYNAMCEVEENTELRINMSSAAIKIRDLLDEDIIIKTWLTYLKAM